MKVNPLFIDRVLQMHIIRAVDVSIYSLMKKQQRQTCGDEKVSTGVWNEDKRAVVVIHVKSTR